MYTPLRFTMHTNWEIYQFKTQIYSNPDVESHICPQTDAVLFRVLKHRIVRWSPKKEACKNTDDLSIIWAKLKFRKAWFIFVKFWNFAQSMTDKLPCFE